MVAAEDELKSSDKEKKQNKRWDNVLAGTLELITWLKDVASNGLAELKEQKSAFWNEKSANLINAQASGLAVLLRDLQEALVGKDWQDRANFALAKLYSFCQAVLKIDELPADLQEDIKQLVGISLKKDIVLASKGHVANWTVLGCRRETQGNVEAMRTWFGAEDGKIALLLEYSYDGNFDTQWNPGTSYLAEMVYYPSAYPLRALPKDTKRLTRTSSLTAHACFDDFLKDYASALAKQPFLGAFPCLLGGMQLVKHKNKWILVDKNGAIVPMDTKFTQELELLAITGGLPACIFGEWEHHTFLPLALHADDLPLELIDNSPIF